MPISFVGANTAIDTTTGTSIAFSPHASTQVGDLMIAVLTRDQDPSGVATNRDLGGFTELAAIGNGKTRFVVGYRFRQSGDSSYTWNFVSNNMTLAVLGVVTYRGVDPSSPFIAENETMDTSNSDKSVTTPTLNNTDAAAWWVAAFGETIDDDSTVSWTANAGTERVDIDTTTSADNPTVAIYDSNGTFATGNHSVTGTLDINVNARELYAWLGILRPEAPPETNVNASAATGSIAASNATVAVQSNTVVNAGTAGSTITASAPTITRTGNPQSIMATASAAAINATVSISESREDTPATATGSAAASNATAAISESREDTPATATGSVAVSNATATISESRDGTPATATGTTTADDATVSISEDDQASPATATGSIAAHDATVSISESREVSAGGGLVSTSVDSAEIAITASGSATPVTATGSVAADGATPTGEANVLAIEAAAGSVNAPDATVDTLAETFADAGTAQVTATAANPDKHALAGPVSGSVAAFDATPTGEASTTPETALGQAEGYNATVSTAVFANAEPSTAGVDAAAVAPSVETLAETFADAGVATGDVAAEAGAVSGESFTNVSAGTASVTATVHVSVREIEFTSDHAPAGVVANGAHVPTPAGLADTSATAHDATITTASSPEAETAEATITALDATISTEVFTNVDAGVAEATVGADQAEITASGSTTADVALVEVAAEDAEAGSSSNVTAEAITAEVSTTAISPDKIADVEVATGTTAALDATISTASFTFAEAGVAEVTGAAQGSDALDVVSTPETAETTASAHDAAVSTEAVTFVSAGVAEAAASVDDTAEDVETNADPALAAVSPLVPDLTLTVRPAGTDHSITAFNAMVVSGRFAAAEVALVAAIVLVPGIQTTPNEALVSVAALDATIDAQAAVTPGRVALLDRSGPRLEPWLTDTTTFRANDPPGTTIEGGERAGPTIEY